MKSLLSLICLLLTGVLAAQTSFTLEEAVAYGMEHSNTLKREQLDIEDAEARVKEYWAIGLPQINGTVDYQHFFDIPVQVLPDFLTPAIDDRLQFYDLVEDPNRDYQTFPAQFGTPNNFTWGVELRTLIFDGSFFVGLEAQRLYRELVQIEFEQSSRDVTYDIKEAYAAVLIARSNREIVENNIDNLEKLLFETKEIYQAGLVEQLDVDRLEFSLDNLMSEASNLETLIDLNQNLLKFKMGYPVNDSIALTDDLNAILAKMNQVDPENLDYSYEDRVEYAVIEKGIELRDVNVRRLKHLYLPTLNGFASYSRSQQGDQLFQNNQDWFPATVAGLQLTVPIWDSYDKSAKIQRARIEKEKVELQKADFERSVDLEIANQQISFTIASNNLENRQRSLRLAEKIYDTALVKYKEGVGSSVELSQAEQSLYQAQGAYSNALYELVVARIALDKALGN